jgi:hypothetical protein
VVTLCIKKNTTKDGGNNCERLGQDRNYKGIQKQFQLTTMEANAITYLFNVIVDIES